MQCDCRIAGTLEGGFDQARRHVVRGERIDGTRLEATAWGERVDPQRHHPAVEVKGATYTTLRVAREAGAWVAQTVVDV